MKNTMKYALFGAVLALVTPVYAEAPDCYKVSTAVKKAVAAHPEKVLALVATQVAQNESCACEVVKAAIVASGADKQLVAGIVEAAITVAPSKVRIIGQCAVAVAPDALAEVQAVVIKHGAVGGDAGHSAKGDKKVVMAPLKSWNPLDTPLGLTPGGPGGFPMFHPGLQPPIVILPTVTPPSSSEEDTNT